MVQKTLLGRIGATGLWVPHAPAAIDGSQFPRGILMRTLTEADIQAGNIADVPIIIGGTPPLVIASDQLVQEGGAGLNTLVNTPAQIASRIRDLMIWANIYVIDNQDIERFQEPAGP
jgi:hypothetical protein